MNRHFTFLFTTLVLLALPVGEALACAVCRPDPNDPITLAADMSVVFLGALVMGIIGLFFSFFGYLYYRSRNPLLNTAALIAEGNEELDAGAPR